MRRDTTVVVLTVALVLAVAAGVGVSAYFAEAARQAERQAEIEKQRADAEAEAARQAKEQAQEQARRAEQLLYASRLQLAHAAFAEGESARALRLLDECQPEPRAWEPHWSRFPGKPPAPEPGEKVPSTAFTPDGKRLSDSDRDPPRP